MGRIDLVGVPKTREELKLWGKEKLHNAKERAIELEEEVISGAKGVYKAYKETKAELVKIGEGLYEVVEGAESAISESRAPAASAKRGFWQRVESGCNKVASALDQLINAPFSAMKGIAESAKGLGGRVERGVSRVLNVLGVPAKVSDKIGQVLGMIVEQGVNALGLITLIPFMVGTSPVVLVKGIISSIAEEAREHTPKTREVETVGPDRLTTEETEKKAPLASTPPPTLPGTEPQKFDRRAFDQDIGKADVKPKDDLDRLAIASLLRDGEAVTPESVRRRRVVILLLNQKPVQVGDKQTIVMDKKGPNGYAVLDGALVIMPKPGEASGMPLTYTLKPGESREEAKIIVMQLYGIDARIAEKILNDPRVKPAGGYVPGQEMKLPPEKELFPTQVSKLPPIPKRLEGKVEVKERAGGGYSVTFKEDVPLTWVVAWIYGIDIKAEPGKADIYTRKVCKFKNQWAYSNAHLKGKTLEFPPQGEFPKLPGKKKR